MNDSSPAHTAFGIGLRVRGDLSLGDQEDAENADEQDRALQEQCRGVDGDRADHRGAADLTVQVAGHLHDRDERGRSGRQR